jgi:hypothetical protein
MHLYNPEFRLNLLLEIDFIKINRKGQNKPNIAYRFSISKLFGKQNFSYENLKNFWSSKKKLQASSENSKNYSSKAFE